MHRFIRRGLTACAIAAALSTVPTGVATAAADPTPRLVTCHELSIPIALLPWITGTRHVSAQMCMPASRPGKAAQVLVSGATYNRTYWQSYARAAATHGYTTVAVDRFNTGHSDRLPSAFVTTDVDATTVHQVIQGLRNASVGGHPYSKVALGGFSLGSVIAVREQALFNDADALMVSGFTHMLHVPLLAGIATGQVVAPAALASPRLAAHPVGDLTTVPGGGREWFHVAGQTDQRVLDQDESTKDVITVGELATFALTLVGPDSNAIQAPVWSAIGSRDAVFACGLSSCDTPQHLAAIEQPRFSAARSFTPRVFLGAGHALALERSAGPFSAEATRWLDRALGV